MKPKGGVTLAISHTIHLTREQRYALADGQEVSVTGVSTPVWYLKGRSSEPAQEVFVRYTLLNDPDSEIDIEQGKDGYTINLPQPRPPLPKPQVPEELWRKRNLAGYYDLLSEPELQTGLYLRDVCDGGATRMMFSQYNKARIKGLMIHLLHFVRIAPVEDLERTMVNSPGCPAGTCPASD